MKKNILAWTIAVTAVIVLLVMTSVSKSPEIRPPAPPKSTQINLALREIGDELLRRNHDFKSLIPPIKHEGEGSYLITLGTKVDYASLRYLIDAILKRHAIRPDYRLSLLNCNNGTLELGFLARAGDAYEDVPCQDREQTTDCYNLRLALIQPPGQLPATPLSDPSRPISWLLLGLAISFPVIWLAWRGNAHSPFESEVLAEDGWLIKSEHTAFHPVNQTLRIKGEVIDLTFREAKLLHFFFEHSNQVLERERILQAVWEDEGVIVGRSLDVFVSRLRKKLKSDPGIQIVNVHGVGYKVML